VTVTDHVDAVDVGMSILMLVMLTEIFYSYRKKGSVFNMLSIPLLEVEQRERGICPKCGLIRLILIVSEFEWSIFCDFDEGLAHLTIGRGF
jgi:hypothetical protein